MHIVTVSSTIVHHAKAVMWCSHFEIEDVKFTGSSVTTDSRSNRDTELVKIAANNVQKHHPSQTPSTTIHVGALEQDEDLERSCAQVDTISRGGKGDGEDTKCV